MIIGWPVNTAGFPLVAEPGCDAESSRMAARYPPIDHPQPTGYATALIFLARPEKMTAAPRFLPAESMPNAGRTRARWWRSSYGRTMRAVPVAGVTCSKEIFVSTLVKQLVEAGVHFGHRSSRWNPKMRPYIYARRDLIHIIDVRETIRGLLRAKKYLQQVASSDSLVLFVGTKRQAAESIQRDSERCRMPYVNDRWLGGTLTNFRTIRSRLSRLEELEAIRDGDEINSYSKKMQSALGREYRKMFRNLNGMRTMNRLPECLVVVDPKKEKNAVKEAQKLGIATVALIDTDCDPDVVDLPIPGNDDSMRSIELIIGMLADAVAAGRTAAATHQQQASEGADKESPGNEAAAG